MVSKWEIIVDKFLCPHLHFMVQQSGCTHAMLGLVLQHDGEWIFLTHHRLGLPRNCLHETLMLKPPGVALVRTCICRKGCRKPYSDAGTSGPGMCCDSRI